MYNSQLPTDGSIAPMGTSIGAGVFDQRTDRHGNERIRVLLKSFGLRTSLIRLKVIDALLSAAEQERSWACAGCTANCWTWISPCPFSACAKC